MKTWTIEEKAQVADLLRRGHAYTDVAERMGCTKNAIAGLWKRIRDKEQPPVPVLVKVAPSRICDLGRLKNDRCRYPFGEGPYKFCGAKCNDVYCETHMKICYFTPKDGKTYAQKMEYWA